jgi:EAL domain-containing protein (putative c-di-GMP-specific phosphodiesterase class I)/AmiR/NasT family two-component response regulator
MRLGDLAIMVVEDHGFQRRVAMRLLEELGLTRITAAPDGRAALTMLEQSASPPDVVLVDLDLPEMDGIEFIGHVASRKLARAIVLTSALDPALLNTVQGMTRAYGLRVLGVVEKPLTTAKLADVLAQIHLTEDLQIDEPDVEFHHDALARALEADEFEPYFQPKVAIASGQVVGVEALARWRHGDRVIGPNQFIGVFERDGLIDAFTERMLERACRWHKIWAAAGVELKVSVNVSMLNLVKVDAADRYQQIVTDNGVKPRDIVIEITESSVMSEAAHALNVLARLRLKGFGLSIDDFGTGYSSLAQLSQIPFTELKIDQGFISGAPRQPRKRAVVETSLDLARKLQLTVVAEGVETVEEWQMLAELGCQQAQGYLISRAVPGNEVLACIRAWQHRDPPLPKSQ